VLNRGVDVTVEGHQNEDGSVCVRVCATVKCHVYVRNVCVYLFLLISYYHAGVCGGSSGCDDAARHFEEPFLSLLPSEEEKKIEPACVRCVCVCVCVCACVCVCVCCSSLFFWEE